MFTHARMLMATTWTILLAIVLGPSLGCRSSHHERTIYEREPATSSSSGCCG